MTKGGSTVARTEIKVPWIPAICKSHHNGSIDGNGGRGQDWAMATKSSISCSSIQWKRSMNSFFHQSDNDIASAEGEGA